MESESQTHFLEMSIFANRLLSRDADSRKNSTWRWIDEYISWAQKQPIR